MVSFDIARTPDGLPTSFTAHLAGLSELGLPHDASVIVEPYFRASGSRFTYGTIGEITPPTDTSLAEIDKGGEILFRVKVIDTTSHVGRLLASGHRIPANAPLVSGDQAGIKPLLPAKPEWLGERIWDISLADTDRPYLLVNNRIPDLAYRIKNDPLLRGSVFVEAFRKIVMHMLDPESAELEWLASWKIFLAKLGISFPSQLFDEDDERDTFVNQAVAAFSNKYQFATQAMITKEPEPSYHE
jgi:hypothetical protein